METKIATPKKENRQPRPASCFQFVKRMNGNTLGGVGLAVFGVSLLPIREAYEWKPVQTVETILDKDSCFQFVKRMNGNIRFTNPIKLNG